MKRLMFYCQHILGIGHLIRSMEIAKGLTSDFEVYFVNGGEIIREYPIPVGIEVMNLPPLKTDAEFRALEAPEGFANVEAAMEFRRDRLLEICDRLRPDVLMVELFPFGRRKFSPELIPLIERARELGAKVVSSLRDIVVTKQDQERHEAKVCKLMNRYFDLLLIHGDPSFMPLERSFSRVADLNCPVFYTGYVVQESQLFHQVPLPEPIPQPLILVSVGGGRFGHELLDCVADAAEQLGSRIPHQIQMFTGPFSPDDVVSRLQAIAQHRSNLTVERYTPNLLPYMIRADLSISMAGYNTTMNVLTTGVRSMLLPFTGNDDQEQTLRSERLDELGVVSVIRPEDLNPERFAQRVVEMLDQTPTSMTFDLNGVANTAHYIRELIGLRSRQIVSV
ncbi:MAG: glycosyltransferase [Leptolyngbyaceae bacterium]|nr:glycosyltransferase [Leptolyngbyaceae bacterium]